MPKRKEVPVCPYCKSENNKTKAIGSMGLVNYNGMEISMECSSCGKYFECDVEVSIKFTTRKEAVK